MVSKISWNQLLQTMETHLFSVDESPILASFYRSGSNDEIDIYYEQHGGEYEIHLDFESIRDYFGKDPENENEDTPMLPVDAYGEVSLIETGPHSAKLKMRFWPLSYNPFTNLP